jgi:tubulin monoglycylase TTLL3/8
MSKVY